VFDLKDKILRKRKPREVKVLKYYLLEHMVYNDFVVESNINRLPLDKRCEQLNLMNRGITGQHSTYRVVDSEEYEHKKDEEEKANLQYERPKKYR